MRVNVKLAVLDRYRLPLDTLIAIRNVEFAVLDSYVRVRMNRVVARLYIEAAAVYRNVSARVERIVLDRKSVV